MEAEPAPPPLTTPVDVVPLLRRPGQRREVAIDAVPVGLGGSGAHVDRLSGTVHVESTTGEITVTGTVVAAWSGACRRCLDPATGTTTVAIRELYERHPVEGETYLLEDETIDLGPMLAEQVLLELPLAPLCTPECAGPAPDRFPAVAARDDGDVGEPQEGPSAGDPRWRALDALRFDD